MKTLAIIPARSGSKGVPGKNVMIINGKPLISYSIEAACNARLIDHVVLSSDSKSILDVALNYPSVEIHHRHSALAADKSPISDTVKDILLSRKELPDIIVLLQPTSPLRLPEQIDSAIAKLISSQNANSIISVVPVNDIHPARMYNIEDHASILNPLMPHLSEARRQDIPSAYYRNGAIYAVKVQAFLDTGSLMASPSCAYVMSAELLLNIDSKRDAIIAAPLMKAWANGDLA